MQPKQIRAAFDENVRSYLKDIKEFKTGNIKLNRLVICV